MLAPGSSEPGSPGVANMKTLPCGGGPLLWLELPFPQAAATSTAATARQALRHCCMSPPSPDRHGRGSNGACELDPLAAGTACPQRLHIVFILCGQTIRQHLTLSLPALGQHPPRGGRRERVAGGDRVRTRGRAGTLAW